MATLRAGGTRSGEGPTHWTESANPPVFEHISVDQGLSQSIVHAILQDRNGFLWFGTEGGLNRYDGQRFKVLRPDASDPNALRSNWITSLLEDREGRIWIGTNGGGLSRMDPSGKLRTFRASARQDSLTSDVLNTLAEDRAGNLWIAVEGGGLIVLPAAETGKENPRFHRVPATPRDPKGLPNSAIASLFVDARGASWIGMREAAIRRVDHYAPWQAPLFEPVPGGPGGVTAMVQDRSSRLWMASPSGLTCLPSNGLIRTFTHQRKDPSSLAEGLVYRLYLDRTGALWVGHDGGGLSLMLPGGEENAPRFRRIRSDPRDPNSLSSDAIEALYEDTSGVLWVSSYQMGLNKLVLNPAKAVSRETSALFHYQHNVAVADSLSGNVVNAFVEDRFGNLWIGTDGHGLDRALRPGKPGQPLHFEAFRHQPGVAGSLQDDVITTAFRDSAQRLWFGTYQGGLVRVEQDSPAGTPRFRHFRHDPKDTTSLRNNFIWAIREDRAHRLWLGHDDGGGLDVFDPATGKVVKSYRPGANGLSSGNIFCLAMDAYDMVWVGTLDGLNRINPGTGKVQSFFPGGPEKLGDGLIRTLFLDSAKTLWVGTDAGGLYRCEVPSWDAAPRFTRYDVRHGLPSNTVNAIVEDSHGQFWISTNRGLCRFDPKVGIASPFAWQESLRKPEFVKNSAFLCGSGELLFGSNNGFYLFAPDKLSYNTALPPIVLTDFQIAGTPLPLHERMDSRGELQLRPKDTMVSFEFAALHFVAPDKNEYSYKLEGLDTDWHANGNRRFITYTTLPPGSYVLRIRGSNCDGQQNAAGLSIPIRVLPPWYKTWWFTTFLGLTLGGLALTIVRLRLAALKTRNALLEHMVQRRTTELAEAMEEVRNMSLTDPLTGLRNRRFLAESLPKDVAQVARMQHDIAQGRATRNVANIDMLFIMVDLDFFKQVNDVHGHHAGDRVLEQVGDILRRVVRTSDTVVRWGGEEFLIVTRNTARADAAILPERIRTAIEAHPFDVDKPEPLFKTGSIGFSAFPFIRNNVEGFAWEHVVAVADACLYAAKRNGRNAWVGIVADAVNLPDMPPNDLPARLAELVAQGLLPVISSLPGPIHWETDPEPSK
ncbi:two-component regulator propeller domain-containing protein [Geothrix sp. PMB-07]|uniref:ligand-binding sensor domain-containing protein n=1 Tax=Geothrix sp. PMB-07 TaxID=3068640 RepID=UPI002740BF8F|nr:ligand-binding sensor domain-containing diguanylate cyclase [Geothrix sp. PMB-07]WLT32060.1 two-component regulator propeller domain-containing protein [Geothrix sp. PMB-07]